VNTSVIRIDLNDNGIIDDSIRDSIDALLDRNERLRSLFLFDARQMLLSLMCADECGVVWSCLLESRADDLRLIFLFDVREILLSTELCDDECGVVWRYLFEDDDLRNIVAFCTIHTEFAVAKERRRRLQASPPEAKRRRLE
jgi:hypothetical protein